MDERERHAGLVGCLRELADEWEPATGSEPEDRWDRGWNAAMRVAAKQLRTALDGAGS